MIALLQKIKQWHIIVLLLIILLAGGKYVFTQIANVKRLQQSYSFSQDSVQTYKAENGKLVATIGVQQLSLSEIKQIYPDIKSEIENLKLSMNRVNTVQTIATQTEKRIITTLKDSVVVVNDTLKHVSTFAYADPYYSLKAYLNRDTLHAKISSRDTLINVIYKKRTKPWLWIFSPTELTQVIENKNPDNKITYNQTIVVKRK
jgi:hypothetical protein